MISLSHWICWQFFFWLKRKFASVGKSLWWQEGVKACGEIMRAAMQMKRWHDGGRGAPEICLGDKRRQTASKICNEEWVIEKRRQRKIHRALTIVDDVYICDRNNSFLLPARKWCRACVMTSHIAPLPHTICLIMLLHVFFLVDWICLKWA